MRVAMLYGLGISHFQGLCMLEMGYGVIETDTPTIIPVLGGWCVVLLDWVGLVGIGLGTCSWVVHNSHGCLRWT